MIFLTKYGRTNKHSQDTHRAVCFLQNGQRQAKSPFGHARKMYRVTSSYTCAKSHPGICSPLKQSIVSNHSVCRQWRPGSDCVDAQADLGLRCPHMPEATFSHGAAKLKAHICIILLGRMQMTCWGWVFDENSGIHFFLFRRKNLCYGYSLKAPRPVACNEYPQHRILWRNGENYPRIITKYSSLISPMTDVLFEPALDKTNNKTCATGEDSDQPAHPRSLIRVFAGRMCLLQLPGY